jgi:WD40 repeat protein
LAWRTARTAAGRLASASWDQTVKVWDAATGQETLTLKGHTGPVDGVAFSPDGRRLASGSEDQTVKIWDAASFQHALRQAEAACRVAPDVATFLNTLGTAYYRVGKYPEAISALEKSIAVHSADGIEAFDLYILAICHSRLDNAAKARDCFERAKDSHQRNAARLTMGQAEEMKQFRMDCSGNHPRTVNRGRR